MSKYLIVKKFFENQPSLNFIVGKRFVDITNFVNPNFSLIKKHFETKVQLSFDSQGGNTLESKEVILGKSYGELPVQTKAQNIFYAGYARDFILRLNITEMPFMIWDKVEDGSWHIDSESGDWTELELGQNIISFTEME